MKTKLLKTAYCCLLLLFAVGCEKKDDNNDLPGGPGAIMLTVVPDSYYNYKVEFGITAQQLIIDWGDGSVAETYTNVTAQIDEHYDDFIIPNITHTYPGSGTYTVQIKGEGLTDFGCGRYQRYQLTSLDVSKCTALEWLHCYSSQLTSLDVSGCTALEWLICSNNKLTSLDVSKCPALKSLWGSSNQLTSLDVSKCTALEVLYFSGNQLTSLDVSKCPALECLTCHGSRLTSLDVSKCPALDELRCGSNQLTSLNVSGCTELEEFDCSDNQLTASALNAVFTALSSPPSPCTLSPYCSWIDISNNPGAATCNKAIAENKGWSVWDY
jgi:Leucine-rich repeat (LRR) protein